MIAIDGTVDNYAGHIRATVDFCCNQIFPTVSRKLCSCVVEPTQSSDVVIKSRHNRHRVVCASPPHQTQFP